jgi:hypothetical protein
MAKATLVVLTNPVSPEQDAEYNDWYNNTHLKDVVAVDGFVSAQRFRVVIPDSAAELPKPSHQYLALYQIEADDLDTVAQALSARAGTDAMQISPALDSATAQAFYVEPLGAPVTGDTATATAG